MWTEPERIPSASRDFWCDGTFTENMARANAWITANLVDWGVL